MENISDQDIFKMVELYGRPSLLWEKAFKLYNSDPNNTRVGMGCFPCYGKVLSYILKQRLTQIQENG